KEINKRVVNKINDDEKYIVYLTPLNRTVKEINEQKLLALKKKIIPFKSIVNGDFKLDELTSDDVLKLAEGAQVMFLNNDSEGRWVNGTLGTVIDFSTDDNLEETVIVELENGEIVEAKPYKWEVFKYRYDEDTKKIEIGSDIVMDVEKYEVTVKGKKVDLTTTEFKILQLLSSKKSWVFTRNQILDYLWNDEKYVLDRTVDVHVRNLREKLGESAEYIKSVRGVGYKLED
ncbi:TPA: hypothetical protein ENS27_09510, partial [bacterium]|nr:hypothetical protein [bacterium]